MRHDALNQASRILLTILLVAVGGIALLMARTAGFGLPDASGLLPQAVVGAALRQLPKHEIADGPPMRFGRVDAEPLNCGQGGLSA